MNKLENTISKLKQFVSKDINLNINGLVSLAASQQIDEADC
jgi:hypothetical protein